MIEQEIIDKITEYLGDIPEIEGDSYAFLTGYGYIQHDEDIVLKLIRVVIVITQPYINTNADETNKKTIHDLLKEIDHLCKENDHKEALRGKIAYVYKACQKISSSSVQSLITRAWERLSNIDSLSREWGQLFYADNPEMGRDIDLTFHESRINKGKRKTLLSVPELDLEE